MKVKHPMLRALLYMAFGGLTVLAILLVTDPRKRSELLTSLDNAPAGQSAQLPPPPAPKPDAKPLPPIRPAVSEADYPWLARLESLNLLSARIAPPKGFVRAPSPVGGFAFWLQHLPLKPGRPDVLVYNRLHKRNQAAHEAVIDINTGSSGFQQGADPIIRLRAEYLFSHGLASEVGFAFASGARCDWQRWAGGERPVVRAGKVTWTRPTGARPDPSYANLQKYMDNVYRYATTASLAKELVAADEKDVQVGDVFIRGAPPGQAALVVDLAVEPRTGRKVVLLAQSSIPAQDVHILKNLASPALSPWYDAQGQSIKTPQVKFKSEDLKRFPAIRSGA
jgi:hypothetical protein